MARGMSEEKVTKTLLQWLINNGWEIICYDFPQSGTGKVLHPSNTASKTDGAIIPDIIAYKNQVVLDFENKDRYVYTDFEKVNFLKNTTLYKKSLDILLKNHPYKKVYYGIGMPYTDNNFKKAKEQAALVDFLTFVKEDGVEIISNEINFLVYD